MSFLRALWDHRQLQMRRARKMQQRAETECSFRVVSGTQAGLSGRWRHGRARLRPGVVEFRRGLPMGIRFAAPWHGWLSIEVVEVSRRGERTSSGAEVIWVTPHAAIVTVTTPTAELEWAVIREQRDWALREVTRNEP